MRKTDIQNRPKQTTTAAMVAEPRPWSDASLALMPVQTCELDLDELARHCTQLGLTGDCIDRRQHRYSTGSRFLEQINFLGCSPNIRFDSEQADEKFTHIILHRYPTPRLFSGRYTRAPHCPECGKAEKNWRLDDFSHKRTINCSHCKHTVDTDRYNWRRTAGFTGMMIEITEIFPKEALPQPTLLENLQQRTAMEWDYFYF